DVLRRIELILLETAREVHGVACLGAVDEVRAVAVVRRHRPFGRRRREERRSIGIRAPAAVTDLAERLCDSLTSLDRAFLSARTELVGVRPPIEFRRVRTEIPQVIANNRAADRSADFIILGIRLWILKILRRNEANRIQLETFHRLRVERAAVE